MGIFDSPLLKTGMTIARFQAFGTLPEDIETLNIIDKGTGTSSG